MSMALAVIASFAGWGLNAVIWADVLCLAGRGLNRRRLQQVAHHVFMELKPFFWAFFLVSLVDDLIGDNLGWLDYLGVAVVAWWGLFVKNRHHDEDDRWKRRRDKAAEAIKRQGARLVVVPAGSPS